MYSVECDPTYPYPDDQAEQELPSPVLPWERGKWFACAVGRFYPILELIEIEFPLVRFLGESHIVAWNVSSRWLESVNMKSHNARDGETEFGSSKAIKEPLKRRQLWFVESTIQHKHAQNLKYVEGKEYFKHCCEPFIHVHEIGAVWWHHCSVTSLAVTYHSVWFVASIFKRELLLNSVFLEISFTGVPQ